MQGVAERSFHTATVIKHKKRTLLVILGGVKEWMSGSDKAWEQNILSDTTLLQLTLSMCTAHTESMILKCY